MDKPAISVVMSVYNGEWYVAEAIESILNQTFPHFEFIIIDDCSIDRTPEILKEYTDSRIRMIRNTRNLGLTPSLNKGLQEALGTYIARMDTDDISHPDRLKKQFEFLETHPEIGLLGTFRMLIDHEGNQIGEWRCPTSDLAIRWYILLNNPFCHSSMMIRTDILRDYNLQYDESFRASQDFELWSRLLRYTRGANLPESLIQYRMGEGIKVHGREEQIRNTVRIAYRNIQTGLPGFEIEENEIFQILKLLFLGSELQENTDPYRIPAARLYFRLFQRFQIEYSDHGELASLRKHIAMEGGHLALRLPLQPGFFTVFWQALQFDALLPFKLILKIPPALWRYRQKQKNPLR